MAEKTTIARPYAKAAFELAQGKGKLREWSELLQCAAQAVAQPQLRVLIGNPRMEADKIGAMLAEVCATDVGEQGRNFLQLLAENKRLVLLPEIAGLYERLRAEAEQTIEAELVTAAPATREQQDKIVAALAKRLGRKVTLKARTDETLIGGAIVKAGDFVIDGSAASQLNKLASALSR